jgi:predicted GIY-YIG superfamily endonuclease
MENSSVEKIVREEISSIPERFRLTPSECRKKKKKEYVCYCLRSVPAKARTYFGSTCDIVHRIRQHNGLLVGGARATSTTRPWRVALIVYGFSSHAAALRFEWFCKMKHSKKAYHEALHNGDNSLERRAALIKVAITKCPNEKLEFFFGDPYLQQCLDFHRDRDEKEEKKEKTCFVSF